MILIRVLFFFSFFFISFFSYAIDPQAFFKAEKIKPMKSCQEGPMTFVLSPIVDPLKKDGCTGSAKIQAISSKCMKKKKVHSTTKQFLDQLNTRARSECEKFCKKRSKKKKPCVSQYYPSPECGLYVAEPASSIMGKAVRCSKACSGTALAFCSLYNTSFQKGDHRFLDSQPLNCNCFLKD